MLTFSSVLFCPDHSTYCYLSYDGILPGAEKEDTSYIMVLLVILLIIETKYLTRSDIKKGFQF